MDISKMTVQIRPRTQWEAIDMGMVVARKWFFRLWMIWLTTALPFLVIILTASLLLPGSAPQWSLLLFWLCKPLFEPPLLLWTSRILFGERLTIRQAIHETRSTTSFKRVLSVLFSRLSPMRSFTMPVLLLEGLTGKVRKQRFTILSRGYETSIYLTLSASVIEILLTLSLVGVLYWLIPDQLRWIDFGDFIFLADAWLTLALYVFACSILSPYYICGGFMLYLSRRVELEAWDLEIGFKQIDKQLREKNKPSHSAVTGVLLCLLMLYGTSLCPPACNAEGLSPESAKETITKVLEQKEFGETKTVYEWVPKEEDKPEKPNTDWLESLKPFFEFMIDLADRMAKMLAGGAKYLVWIGAGIIIALILWRYSKIRKWLGKYFPDRLDRFTPPDELFGMDIRPESLPDDIGSACRELLGQQKKREALSLLYRGVLSHLINTHHVHIYASQTENECCAIIKTYRPQSETSFFSHLTALWLTTAYGHREPALESCLEIVDRWQELYGEQQ
ncbi:hypothetical protein [Desulfopila sp. IMCC35008]|uniref:hypothetical protein n=1 Tax=Desulfopila sp. IMCC35008 TaxID=2653858 RepID=UPI0013D03F11|nr:hypothetical protein [Desulfopila sp. IMCC35008]